jgi:hypothetical protein
MHHGTAVHHVMFFLIFVPLFAGGRPGLFGETAE